MFRIPSLPVCLLCSWALSWPNTLVWSSPLSQLRAGHGWCILWVVPPRS
jgi:hypothetical protein